MGFDHEAYRKEMRAKRGQSTGSVREHTAKTVNEELHALVASCNRIYKRLQSKPGCPKLTELLARQQATLDAAIVAAKEGRVWRHRGQIAHMNNGLDKVRADTPLSSVKTDSRVLLIPGDRD